MITLKKEEAEQLDLWVEKMLKLPDAGASKKYANGKNGNKGRGKTYIRDSIWKNIELQEHELTLLSTPLMQRLRRIKQLSSGYLLYPGAMHTRFEHSLGVLAQTEKMCEWLVENKQCPIGKLQRNNLRFAALCHDLGHGPFSHASEAFFKTLPPFGKEEEEDGSAEQLSALIVRSKSFRDFCRKLPEDINATFVAKAITGCLPYKHLGSIIKGPFDADKIDYLIRDGHYCGIPINFDVEIIYRFLTVNGKGSERELVGEAKALPPLIQLSRFRQYMFAAVYNHKVARIFDAMFAKAMDCAHKDCKTTINGQPLETAFNFLELDNEMLLSPGIVTEGTAAADLLDRLRSRNLFKVAFEFDNNPNCLKCKGSERQKDGSDCDKCDKVRKKKRKKIKSACQKSGIESHYVLFDKARAITYDEASKMLIKKEGTLKMLKEFLDLSKESKSLQGFMGKDLVCCPVEHVKEVKKLAEKALG